MNVPQDKYIKSNFSVFFTLAFLLISEVPVEFTATLSEQHVEEKTECHFTCELNKENVPVTWYKGTSKIVPSHKYEIQDIGTSHTLVIKDVSKDDVAEYTVKIDDLQNTASLYVDGKSSSMLYHWLCSRLIKLWCIINLYAVLYLLVYIL